MRKTSPWFALRNYLQFCLSPAPFDPFPPLRRGPFGSPSARGRHSLSGSGGFRRPIRPTARSLVPSS